MTIALTSTLHDLGFLAVTDGDEVIGYNVLVGGGFGMTPSAKKTFPALAQKLCHITPDQVLDVATAVVQVQRDFGNRADRKVARLKYLVADWGIERFKSKVDEYLRFNAAHQPLQRTSVGSRTIWAGKSREMAIGITG